MILAVTPVEVYQIIISSVLTIVVFIVGYWLNRFIKSVDKLAETVTQMQIDQSGNSASCKEKHIGINARLRTHDETIDDHEIRLNEHGEAIAALKMK